MVTRAPHTSGFRHEALLYAGEEGFVEGTVPFIHDGLAAGEPVVAMVSSEKADLIRDQLGRAADEVRFADMREVGANPAHIIPEWLRFVAELSAPGRGIRGIGEPIWPDRSQAELVECQRHEALLNVAFADGSPLFLLCPYDTEALEPSVIEEAHRSHPLVVEEGAHRASVAYRGTEEASAPFAEPLAEPPAGAAELAFEGPNLEPVRNFAAVRAAGAGLGAARRAALVLAVNEMASNSVRHGGGRGVLRVWREEDAIVAEVRDSGQIEEP